MTNATLAIDCADTIGEGPTWDAAEHRLLWSDNAVGVIHETRPDAAGGWPETRRWNLGRPIAAAIPRLNGGLVVAAGTKILALNDLGEITPIACLDVDPDLVRLNDAKCDPQGRLWAGTLDNDLARPGQEISAGRCALYRIDPGGEVTTVLENVTLSNGLAWSPDGSIFYYIDTYTRSIDAFDFDGPKGEINNRRTVVSITPGEGLPDGMTVDRDGCLWVAIAGSGQVRRYAPNGVQLAKVEVGTPTPTSCAFGGEDGAVLFITSATVRLPERALTTLTHGFSIEHTPASPSARGAGGLFTCRPGATGASATPFGGWSR